MTFFNTLEGNEINGIYGILLRFMGFFEIHWTSVRDFFK